MRRHAWLLSPSSVFVRYQKVILLKIGSSTQLWNMGCRLYVLYTLAYSDLEAVSQDSIESYVITRICRIWLNASRLTKELLIHTFYFCVLLCDKDASCFLLWFLISKESMYEAVSSSSDSLMSFTSTKDPLPCNSWHFDCSCRQNVELHENNELN